MKENYVIMHCAKNTRIRSHILPYWDRLLPYIGIRRPYTGKYGIVFRRFSGSDGYICWKLRGNALEKGVRDLFDFLFFLDFFL